MLSGTPAQVKPLIPSAENGLFSRQLFYFMPPIDEWMDQFDSESEDYGLRFATWGTQWKQVLDLINGSVQTIQLRLSEKQKELFNQRFAQLFSHAGYAYGGSMRSRRGPYRHQYLPDPEHSSPVKSLGEIPPPNKKFQFSIFHFQLPIMITFVCCLIALIVGYFIYGKFIERIFGIDAKRQTPAYTHQDGVDYIPMPTWKVFMIQFLNIAGLGPIFGAIMGAKFGTASFLWIVLGSIFAGSVHDYLSGMLSLRHNGESLPEIIGRYLGVNFKQFMRGFTVILMVLVGSVFVAGPAGLLAKLTPEHLDTTFWIIVVFLYYILATLLPVDKIIGKIYPLFAAALLFMAIGILVMLFVNHPPLPEITDGMPNTYPGHLPIFPIMFVSIACGAISGFHATQSPLMARCIKNEKYGRPIFFGSMITEGIVALIWAAAATYFYHNNGMGENNAAVVVDSITKEWSVR